MKKINIEFLKIGFLGSFSEILVKPAPGTAHKSGETSEEDFRSTFRSLFGRRFYPVPNLKKAYLPYWLSTCMANWRLVRF